MQIWLWLRPDGFHGIAVKWRENGRYERKPDQYYFHGIHHPQKKNWTSKGGEYTVKTMVTTSWLKTSQKKNHIICCDVYTDSNDCRRDPQRWRGEFIGGKNLLLHAGTSDKTGFRHVINGRNAAWVKMQINTVLFPQGNLCQHGYRKRMIYIAQRFKGARDQPWWKSSATTPSRKRLIIVRLCWKRLPLFGSNKPTNGRKTPQFRDERMFPWPMVVRFARPGTNLRSNFTSPESDERYNDYERAAGCERPYWCYYHDEASIKSIKVSKSFSTSRGTPSINRGLKYSLFSEITSTSSV